MTTQKEPSDLMIPIAEASLNLSKLNQDLSDDSMFEPTVNQDDEPSQLPSIRVCWICLKDEMNNPAKKFIQPCKCEDDYKFVHQSCLHSFVKQDLKNRIRCQNCKTKFIVSQPSKNCIEIFVERIDRFISKHSEGAMEDVAILMYLGSVYLNSIFSGVQTVMQIDGFEMATEKLCKASYAFVFLVLPSIPIGLVIFRAIRWNDLKTRFLRGDYRCSFKLLFLPEPIEDSTYIHLNTYNVSSIVCQGVLFPTIANLFGQLLFKQIKNNWKRCFMGGLTFIALEGALKLCYKYKKEAQIKGRKIVDRTEDNIQT